MMQPAAGWGKGLAGAGVLGFAAAAALAAATYQVNLTSALNGLDIVVETVENPGMLIVKLTNRTPQKVRCRLRYDAQPQPLGRQTVYIAPGKTEQSVFRATRRWFDVDVAVECETESE